MRRRGGLWSVIRLAAKLHLSLIRAPGEQPLRTVDFALQDTELNLLLFPPPAVPPKQLDEAVLRLPPQ